MIKIKSYDYSGLIKSYLTQNRPSAKTAQNRMSYSEIYLYSYDSVLAKLDTERKIIYIDSDIAHYSITSTKQANTLRAEAKDNFTRFEVPIDASAEDTVTYYTNIINNAITKHARARVEHSKRYWKSQIFNTLNELTLYLDLHTIKNSKLRKVTQPIFKQLFELKFLKG